MVSYATSLGGTGGTDGIYCFFKRIEDNTSRTDNAVTKTKTTQNNSKKHHPYNEDNEKNEAQLKIEAEKQAELDKQILLRTKKDHQQGKCPECGEKIDKELIKCFVCGAILSSFE